MGHASLPSGITTMGAGHCGQSELSRSEEDSKRSVRYEILWGTRLCWVELRRFFWWLWRISRLSPTVCTSQILCTLESGWGLPSFCPATLLGIQPWKARDTQGFREGTPQKVTSGTVSLRIKLYEADGFCGPEGWILREMSKRLTTMTRKWNSPEP